MKTLRSSRRGGFTLIEMLIVIGIIGILAVGLGRLIVGGPQKARDASRKQAMTQIVQAIEAYNVDTGAYPTVGGVAITDRCFDGVAADTQNPGLDDYFPQAQIPLDPSGSQNYSNTGTGAGNCTSFVYVPVGTGGVNYVLYGRMEDEASGNLAANFFSLTAAPAAANITTRGRYFVIVQ